MNSITSYPSQAYDYVYGQFGLTGLIGLIVTTVILIVSVLSNLDLNSIVNEAGEPTMTEQEMLDELGSVVVLALLYPVMLLMSLIGLILGILGIKQKNRKRSFSVAGTILSGIPLLFLIVGFILMLAGA